MKKKPSKPAESVESTAPTSPVTPAAQVAKALSQARAHLAQSQWQAALDVLLVATDAVAGEKLAEVEDARALAHYHLGQFSKAWEAFERALQQQPSAHDIRANYAFSLQKQRLYPQAEKQHEIILKACPTHTHALTNYCAALEHASDGLARSEQLCQTALQHDPKHPAAPMILAKVMLLSLRQAEGLAILEGLVKNTPQDTALLARYYFHAEYCAHVPAQRLSKALRAHGQLWARQYPAVDRAAMLAQALQRRQKNPQAPLRVGILTADARMHPIGQLLAGFLADINPQRVELTLYAEVDLEDEITAVLRRSVAHFVPTFGWSDAQLHQRLLQDHMDVLVDAIGLTSGHRMAVLAQRAAPVQLAWAGYISSTGLPSMDGYIADATTSAWPVEQLFSEPVFRLPECVYSYRPHIDRPEVATLPALAHGYVTFGSFNSLAKVNAATLDLWAAVLRAVPNARMALKAASLGDRATQHRLSQAFADRGIAAERLLLGVPSEYYNYLEDFSRMDIMLDCVPFNGGMTTLDGLWQGVPLLALEGQTHASRVGMSIMRTLGLTDWIAHDPNAYVALAVSQAQDVPKLAQLRSTMRLRLAHSALGDTRRFAAQMVAVWEDAWQQACTSLQ